VCGSEDTQEQSENGELVFGKIASPCPSILNAVSGAVFYYFKKGIVNP
jgi:hypothetical protein